MIRYKEIAFTAYPVTQIARARRFYEGVLGLKPSFRVKPGSKFIEYNLGPGTIAIGSSPQWKPSKNGPSAAFEVIDFEAAVAHLRKKKVRFVMGPLDLPSCQMAAMRDPDGNTISIHKRKGRGFTG